MKNEKPLFSQCKQEEIRLIWLNLWIIKPLLFSVHMLMFYLLSRVSGSIHVRLLQISFFLSLTRKEKKKLVKKLEKQRKKEKKARRKERKLNNMEEVTKQTIEGRRESDANRDSKRGMCCTLLLALL